MERFYRKVLRDERGSVLVVTMLVLFTAVVIGATLSTISSTDIQIAGNQRFSTNALYLAEAGLNEAIHRLSLPSPTNINVGGNVADASIQDTPPYDPNWKTFIYLRPPGATPVQTGSVFLTGTIQDPNQPYLNYSRSSGAKDILAIEHKWQDRNGDGVRDADEIVLYDTAKIPPDNFTSGFPVEVITVPAQSGRGKRTIQAEVTRKAIRVRTLGALYTDKAIEIAGNPAFCGYDHDMNVPVGTKPMGCNGFHVGGGDLPAVTTTGDAVDVSGAAADLDGYPAPTDTSTSNPFYNIEEVLGMSTSELNQLLAQADHTTMTNPFHGITYIQGDASITSNYVGSGLLYVTGDLQAAGGWEFKGLIYVEGDMKLTGTPWILGSVIVRGTSDYNISAGDAAVLYSSEALTTYLSQTTPMVLLSWREL